MSRAVIRTTSSKPIAAPRPSYRPWPWRRSSPCCVHCDALRSRRFLRFAPGGCFSPQLRCGLLVQWLFLRRLHGRSSDLDGLFYFGVFAIPVCLVAAALIPGRGGRIVLAGTAVLATSSTVASSSIDVSVDPLWTYGLVLVCAVAVATGAALGQRWKRPLIGTAVLAVVCLTALFDGPTGDVAHYAASSVIFPAAAAYLYVSCNADTAPALTVGLAVPVAITVPMVLSYGWTAYTPLTSVDSSTFSPSLDLWISTGTACAAVALAAAGIQALDRYRAVL
jgi:hypothetical protein